jgi:hypothetical protein
VDARRLRGLNGLQRGLITVGGVPQKTHPTRTWNIPWP